MQAQPPMIRCHLQNHGRRNTWPEPLQAPMDVGLDRVQGTIEDASDVRFAHVLVVPHDDRRPSHGRQGPKGVADREPVAIGGLGHLMKGRSRNMLGCSQG